MARPIEPASASSQVAITPGGATSRAAALAEVSRSHRFRVGVWLMGLVVTAVLRLRHATWRKDERDGARLDELLAHGERVIAVFWHGKYVPLFTLLRGRKACVFASLSFRGSVIAEICRRLGYDCVLLPDNGGATSRTLIRDALGARSAGAFAVDGPRGPYHAVKPGAIEVASQFGFVLLPVTVVASPVAVNAARWDRMETPRLFARVRLVVGDPLRVPASLTPADIAAWQVRVGRALDDLDGRPQAALLPQGEAVAP